MANLSSVEVEVEAELGNYMYNNNHDHLPKKICCFVSIIDLLKFPCYVGPAAEYGTNVQLSDNLFSADVFYFLTVTSFIGQRQGIARQNFLLVKFVKKKFLLTRGKYYNV